MFDRSRVTRRRFLAGALTTGSAAGLILAGCGGGEDGETKATPGTTATAGEPKKGGTIRTSTPSPILGLDPNITEGVAVAPYFYSYVVWPTDWYEPGTPFDETGKTWPTATVGDLATSWETPDDTHWIFHLRNDAHFQNIPPANGRLLVAEDVVKSIDRYRAQPGASTAWDQWTEKYEAPDAETFTILTKQPYGYMLMDLGSPLTAIMAVEAVEQFGDLKGNTAGSGPFMLQSHDRNTGLELVRNPTYYRNYPYIDGYSTKVISDDSAIQAAFRAGQLDVYLATNKPKADSVKNVSGVTVQRFVDRVYTVFSLNAVKNPLFKDDRVREAIDLALDRKEMISKLTFGEAELAGPVPPLWPAALPADEIEKAYTRDVQKAKQLLQAANQENLTFQLDFANYQDNPDRAAIIQNSLKEAGMTVNLNGAELGTWLGNLLSANFESTTFGHLRYLSDYIQINTCHSKGWGHNDAGYLGVDNAEIDGMLDQSNGTIDEAERTKLEQDIQRKYLAQHGPTFVLYQPYAYWAAYDYIKGYTPTSYGFGLYKYNFWIDKG